MQENLSELDAAANNLITALEKGEPLELIKELYANYKQLAGDTTFTKLFPSQINTGEKNFSCNLPLIMLAIMHNHTEAMNFFREEGASLDVHLSDYYTTVRTRVYRLNLNALDLAVLYGHDTIVSRLVDHFGFAIDTPILPPVKNQDQILRYLINRGFNPCTLTQGTSMIHICAEFNYASTLKLIDQLSTDNNLPRNYDVPNSDKYTPLSLASGEESLAFFIAKGADVNSIANDFETPLHFAVRKGSVENVRLLLQAKAHPEGNLADENEYTPFVIAASQGNVAIARLLYTHGANPESGYWDSDNDDDNEAFFKTHLHTAIENNRTEFLEFLVKELKLDPNAKNLVSIIKFDVKWLTPLEYASWKLNHSAVELLLEYGADPNFTAVGATHNAISAVLHPTNNDKDPTQKYKIIKLLLSHGADIKFIALPQPVEDQPRHLQLLNNYDSLYKAVERKDLARILDLINRDKDLVGVKFPNGDTLLHVVIALLDQSPTEEQLALIRLLAEQSNQLHTRDNSGKVPIECARDKHLLDVVELLTSDLEKQLELVLTDDVIPVIQHLLSGYKSLHPQTQIPDGIQFFITEMITSLKLLEPQNTRQIENLDQITCLRKLFLARFNTLQSFMETPGLIYEQTANRINKLLSISQVDLSNREKFGLLPAMTFNDTEIQTLFRGLSNLHHVCNNELRAKKRSDLIPREMPLETQATPRPDTTTASPAVTTSAIGFYSTKRKGDQDQDRNKPKKGKPGTDEDVDKKGPQVTKP